MEQGRLARGIRPDNRRDLVGEAHGYRLGAEAAKAGEGNSFETHDALFQLPRLKPCLGWFRAVAADVRIGQSMHPETRHHDPPAEFSALFPFLATLACRSISLQRCKSTSKDSASSSSRPSSTIRR